jgi:hypothetical protein
MIRRISDETNLAYSVKAEGVGGNEIFYRTVVTFGKKQFLMNWQPIEPAYSELLRATLDLWSAARKLLRRRYTENWEDSTFKTPKDVEKEFMAQWAPRGRGSYKLTPPGGGPDNNLFVHEETNKWLPPFFSVHGHVSKGFIKKGNFRTLAEAIAWATERASAMLYLDHLLAKAKKAEAEAKEALELQLGAVNPFPLLLTLSVDTRYYGVYKKSLWSATKRLTSQQWIALITDKAKREDSKLAALGNRTQRVNKREFVSDETKIDVWRRDGGKCVKCGSRERLEFDHIIPVALGGSSTARNIELLCEECNRSKGASVA